MEPERDPKTGLCVICRPGEAGEMVSRVFGSDRGGPENFKAKLAPILSFFLSLSRSLCLNCGTSFIFSQAYVKNEEETRKKILRDVYRRGDVCFRSGDLMVKDEDGWVYFQVGQVSPGYILCTCRYYVRTTGDLLLAAGSLGRYISVARGERGHRAGGEHPQEDTRRR